MKMNFIKKALTLFALGAIIISCDEDQQVGDSQMTPASPTISIDLDFSNPTLVEDDSEHTYTVSLSQAQIVDTKLHISQIGGTASGADYEMTGLVTIPAGYLSASGSITILSDDLIEDTETLQIQIGGVTTANASLTPVTTEFTILNYTDGDLVIDLGWDMSIATDDAGEEIGATDFADMRLLVSTTPDNAGDIGEADGGSFETFVLDGSTPDGTYYVVADFYAANENITRVLDFNVEFNQSGVINGLAYDFPAAMSNANTCDGVYYVLAELVKTGDSYAITSVGENQPPLDAEGQWYFYLADAYGDGWDGAYITVTIDGVSTDYTCDADEVEYYIDVPAGAVMTIDYTPGDWEEEHHLDIILPNGDEMYWGSQWSGTNIPEGLLYDNLNPCI